MAEQLLLVLLIVFSIAAIQTPRLDHAVIYLGMFSFLCSLLYLLYKSPNVAIAEAVIGCTLATVIYLVALRKQKRFTVYVLNRIADQVLGEIDRFCGREDLIFHYIRFSKKQYPSVLGKKDGEVVIYEDSDGFVFVSRRYNYKVEALASHLSQHPELNLQIQLLEMGDRHEMETL